jgi:hypothetical protein
MKTHEKIMIGGIGALTPTIVNLLVVDVKAIMLDITTLVVAVYLLKVIAYFFVGGFVAYLHTDEQNRVKLFELGIMAPAMVMLLVNGAQREVQQTAAITKESPEVALAVVWSPPVTHAEDTLIVPLTPAPKDRATRDSMLNVVEVFALPKESTLEQIKRGFLGSTTNRIYFVVVAKDTSLASAKELAGAIMNNGEGYKAQVYAPYGNDLFYSVVIGAHLTYKEAMGLRRSALRAGLPESTTLWALPKKLAE